MNTTLTRWEPFRELATLRTSMDRLMDRFFEEPFEFSMVWPKFEGDFRPAMDLAETEEAYDIKAALPGIKPEDVEVSLADNVLTIKGESKEESETEKANYRLREMRAGKYMRTLTLPANVNADKIDATVENGILMLHLPKTEAVKPKKISVKATPNGAPKAIPTSKAK